MESKKEPTKEQTKKIGKAYLRSMLRTSLAGAYSGLLLGLANIVIATVAATFNFELNTPRADAFMFLSCGTTIFFIFRSLGRKIKADHDKVREEIKKILEE